MIVSVASIRQVKFGSCFIVHEVWKINIAR